jgi:hypothetical protein
MNRTKSVCVIAGAALSLGSLAMAGDEQRALAAELLADAGTRTSQLAQDQRFSVDVHGYFQFRYNINSRDEPVDEGGDPLDEDLTLGFQMARARINVSGNIINENWGYFVQFGSTPDGSFIVDDIYGTFRYEGGWQVQFGQFKLPFARETLVGDQYLLAADRSITEAVFGLERSQGLMFGFVGDQVRFSAAVSDGGTFGGSDGFTGRDTDFDVTLVDFAISGRLEFKWAGDWVQAEDLTSFQGSNFFGMVGVAGHYQSGGNTAHSVFGVTPDHDAFAFTVDVSVESSGWNVMAAGFYLSIDFDGMDTLDDMGFMIHAGFFVTPQAEIFGRFDWISPDSNWGNDEDFMAITAGLNYYFVPESHAAKFTLDFLYTLESPLLSGPVDLITPNTLVGLLPDEGDPQWNIRAQLQILF